MGSEEIGWIGARESDQTEQSGLEKEWWIG